MNKFIDFIFQSFSKWFLTFFFALITLGSLLVTAYYVPDQALFRNIQPRDFMGMFISAILLGLLIYISYHCDIKNYYLLFAYGFSSVAFILLVPLMPFSDMLNVYTLAVNNLQGDLTYLQQCPNNLAIVLVFAGLLKIYKDPIVIKLIQILCNLVIIGLTVKIYKKVFNTTDDKVIVLILVCNIPTILYTNHVYSDIIATLFAMIALYYLLCFDSGKRRRLHFLIIGCSLLFCFVIRPNCIIFIIATIIYLCYQKEYKFLFCVIASFMLAFLGFQFLSSAIIPRSDAQYPVWSYLQMGLNKDRIGFQDGTHSAYWTFQDVIEKIKELGFFGIIKLFVKKNFWTWSEGTYQARRYAFSYDDAIFQYHTPYISYLANNETFFMILNGIMKGYYFIIILLCTVGVFFLDKRDAKTNFLSHVVIGFIAFYSIWEIKSRYIYILYPIFSIFAAYGICKICGGVKNNKILRG